MPYFNNMKKRARELFDEDLDTVIPMLLDEFKTPGLVAGQLGVYPNAVRHWLITHAYEYDKDTGAWVKTEVEHAS